MPEPIVTLNEESLRGDLREANVRYERVALFICRAGTGRRIAIIGIDATAILYHVCLIAS